jgi:hypothetical protein
MTNLMVQSLRISKNLQERIVVVSMGHDLQMQFDVFVSPLTRKITFSRTVLIYVSEARKDTTRT